MLYIIIIIYHIAPNFVKLLKSHECNFLDKNFMIATFFCDYLRAVVSAQTIHVVTPPIILTCGFGLVSVKRNELK